MVLLVVVAALSFPRSARADDQTRQVQEELRRRHIFNGDIDGRITPALFHALRRYQERKHLAVNGMIDDETLRSLGIQAPPAEGPEPPDVAILKSDAHLPQKGGAATSAVAATPVSTKTAVVTEPEADAFIRAYFAACQSRQIEDELKFYGERVNYYDHGVVDRTYIRNELAVYDQHWPERQYSLSGQLRLTTPEGGNPVARCRSMVNVCNPARLRQGGGPTNNVFELVRGADSHLQIVAIHESRVRSHARGASRPLRHLVRRVGGAVRSLTE